MDNRRNTRRNLLAESGSPTASPLTRRSRLRHDSSSPVSHSNLNKSQQSDWISENESDSQLSEDSISDEETTRDSSRNQTKNSTPDSKSLKRTPLARSEPDAVKQQKKSSSPCSATSSIEMICLVGVLSVLAYFLCHQKPMDYVSKEPVDNNKDLLISRLIGEMKVMQQSFPLQMNETWWNYIAAFSSIMEDDPPQPAVLLLIGPNSPQGIETVQCVAERMARITNNLFDTSTSQVAVNVQEILRRQQKEDAIKEELDGRLRSVLNHSFSVVLGPLELIPPKVALLLHGYSDNFAAPFKKRIIILTATFSPTNLPAHSRQVDRMLSQLWDSDLGTDKSASLVSRVANSPVFIHPEPRCL